MDDDHDDEPVLPCGICGGPLVLLGQSGPIVHYRCRDCGMEHYTETDTEANTL